MLTKTDPMLHQHVDGENTFSPLRGVFAIFTNGIGLSPGSVSLIAGDHPVTVDAAVQRVMQLAPIVGESRVHKLVPMVDRDATTGVGDLRFLLGPRNRRVCGKVLAIEGRGALEQIGSVIAFAADCLGAWAYYADGRPSAVLLELDDFCEFVGVAHIGALLAGLANTAIQFDVAVLAIANRARLEIHTALLMGTEKIDAARLRSPVSPQSISPVVADIDSECHAPASDDNGVTDSHFQSRSRNPLAQDIILQTLANAPSPLTPIELAARIAGRVASDRERATIRKHLQNMKRNGKVATNEGRYSVATPTAVNAARASRGSAI